MKYSLVLLFLVFTLTDLSQAANPNGFFAVQPQNSKTGNCSAFVKTTANETGQTSGWLRHYQTVKCKNLNQTKYKQDIGKYGIAAPIDSIVTLQLPVNYGNEIELSQGCFLTTFEQKETPPYVSLGKVDGVLAKSGLFEFKFSLNKFVYCANTFVKITPKLRTPTGNLEIMPLSRDMQVK